MVEVGVLKPRPGFGPKNFYLGSRFGISPEAKKPTKQLQAIFPYSQQRNRKTMNRCPAKYITLRERLHGGLRTPYDAPTLI